MPYEVGNSEPALHLCISFCSELALLLKTSFDKSPNLVCVVAIASVYAFYNHPALLVCRSLCCLFI
ncbi:hypothetical protein RchiOBHm_Chr5g0060401 [Rosa chinensis]|uniref:Uncharacterized protein n=1 Tax=Rosa chinensis TaxID=74649 RepID=A0A2P6QHP3_ROSCH|nr:hypothetical protein RchiOBHm_Chr5g0060401 [Rosa chinensis]